MKKTIIIVSLFIGFTMFSQKSKFDTYRVSSSETVTSIARKLGITPYDLIKLNPDAANGINIDEVLIVPKTSATSKLTKKLTVPKTSTTVVNTQTKVIASVKSKDSIVDGYIYHTVRPLETVYSLSSKYKASKRKVRKLNNLNRKGDISIGQLLKFPTDKKNSCPKKDKTPNTKEQIVVKETSIVSEEAYFSYLVKPKDTYYTLTRVYHVTKEELIKWNPILSEGLKSGLELKIPKSKQETVITKIEETPTKMEEVLVSTENIVVVDNNIPQIVNDTIASIEAPKYRTHIVQEKEGFFKLKQLYGFTESEFKQVNPSLIDGLKLGMQINIPNIIKEELLVEGDIHGKILNVVMLLPFKADSNISFNEDTKQAARLNKVTDFYLGSLMALDSIKKKGLSVNLRVLDTKNSDFVVKNILSTNDFSQTDLVIAPIKLSQFKEVAKKLEKNNVPVISPLSTKNYSILGVSNSIQNTPVEATLKNKMLAHILAKVSNQNVIIIADEIKPGVVSNLLEIESIKAKLLKKDSIKSVAVIRTKDGYIDRTLFEDNIKENKENWVILASVKKEITSNVIDNLAVFPKTFKITLFSLLKPENINTIEKAYILKSEYLNKLSFQYPESSFIDDKNQRIINFNNKYHAKFNGLPTDLSYKGFDSTYDALIRLANFDDMKSAFSSGETTRLISKFNYKQNITNSFSNKGVFIVRYNDYKLEKVY